MSEWPLRRLGSVTSKIGSGATPRGGASVYRQSGTSLIRSQNVLDNSMRVEGVARISVEAADTLRGVTVEAGDVLINITGDSIARCALVDSRLLPARVNQHVAIVRTINELDGRFLQRYLVSPSVREHLLALSQGGGTRKALTKAQLSDLEVPCPPISVQRAISEVLGALDDKIAANTALARTADNLCAALCSQSAKRVPLSTLCRYVKASREPADMGEPFVAHFSLPAFDASRLPDIARPAEIKSSKFVVDHPSVLVSKLNPRFPRVWDLAEIPRVPALASTEFLVLEPLACSTSTLAALLLQPEVSSALQAKARGTSGSHQRVRPDDLLATTVGDPRSLPTGTDAQVRSVGAHALRVRQESVQLADTRDALLPALMSGRLRVKDAEAVAESVL